MKGITWAVYKGLHKKLPWQDFELHSLDECGVSNSHKEIITSLQLLTQHIKVNYILPKWEKFS